MTPETLTAGFAFLAALLLGNTIVVALLALRLPAYQERTQAKLEAKPGYKSDELCLLERIAEIYRPEPASDYGVIGIEWSTNNKKPDKDPYKRWNRLKDSETGRVVLIKRQATFLVRFGKADEYEFAHFEMDAAARVYHDARGEIRAREMMLIAEGNDAAA